MLGRWMWMSPLRRVTSDLLVVSQSIPTVPVQRVMDLGPLAEARERLARRPCWPAIFLKAYALVSDRTPELRRAVAGLTGGRQYEFANTIASVAVERVMDGETGVLFGRLTNPAARPLMEVHDHVRQYAEGSVADVGQFRAVFRLARLPGCVRRSLMRLTLRVPRSRAKFFGTFGLTVYSSLGAESLHPISPLTTTLTYGVIDAHGRVAVRVVYDHRVLDGATVARALRALEDVLNGEICDEIRTLCRLPLAA